MRPSNQFLLYLIFSALYLIGMYFLPDSARIIFKALLVPMLLNAVWNSPAFSGKNLLMAALFFSVAGDVSIEYNFIAGLVSFLTAHLFYIVLFYRLLSGSTRSKPLVYAGWAALAVYLGWFLYQLLPEAGALQAPVAVYALVIGTMLALAIAGYSYWSKNAALWVIGGAVSFVVSDSALAWNKFHTPLGWWGPLLIMSTYLWAQYAITIGVLEQTGRKNEG
jgi:uncharacterized membrane protein YhhN